MDNVSYGCEEHIFHGDLIEDMYMKLPQGYVGSGLPVKTGDYICQVYKL